MTTATQEDARARIGERAVGRAGREIDDRWTAIGTHRRRGARTKGPAAP